MGAHADLTGAPPPPPQRGRERAAPSCQGRLASRCPGLRPRRAQRPLQVRAAPRPCPAAGEVGEGPGLAGGKQAVLGRVLQGVRVSVHLGESVCTHVCDSARARADEHACEGAGGTSLLHTQSTCPYREQVGSPVLSAPSSPAPAFPRGEGWAGRPARCASPGCSLIGNPFPSPSSSRGSGTARLPPRHGARCSLPCALSPPCGRSLPRQPSQEKGAWRPGPRAQSGVPDVASTGLPECHRHLNLPPVAQTRPSGPSALSRA